MKRIMTVVALLAFAALGSGCTRIETGEVGLRVGFDKQVNLAELQPGSFNQVMIGDVLTFPVREISLHLDDIHPQTKDTSTLADMDVTVIYGINPASVGELYTKKSRGMHLEENGDIYLMYNYLLTIANSAAYKAVQRHNAMDVMGARGDIENEVLNIVKAALAEEKLDTSITVTKVQVRNAQPAQSIIDSANAAISAQNQLKTSKVAVEIAQQEAARQTLLSRPANLEYMKVQAALNISEGVRDGKVQTIIVPSNLTMLGMSK
jgi:regulator of protease activity HflC (stomatin/prohibitin superfamily)